MHDLWRHKTAKLFSLVRHFKVRVACKIASRRLVMLQYIQNIDIISAASMAIFAIYRHAQFLLLRVEFYVSRQYSSDLVTTRVKSINRQRTDI